MFLQNFIELSAAVDELSYTEKKNAKTLVSRYRSGSNNKQILLYTRLSIPTLAITRYVYTVA